MALLGAPIMLVLFMLFPRMAPLWGIPSDGMTGRSGLSPTMSVGSIASLVLDDSIVMRLRFEDRPPPQSTLYFRGPVLSRFDGREWQAEPVRLVRTHAVAHHLWRAAGYPRPAMEAAVPVNQVVLDAPARHTAHRAPVLPEHHHRAHRSRRRAPGAHHGGDEGALPFVAPAEQGAQDGDVEVFHG